MASTFKVEIAWDAGVWTDETDYVQYVHSRIGFEEPGDLVAAVGRCEIMLDNSTRRFSPGNTGSPLYGKLLPRREVRVTALASATESWVLFRGYIECLEPSTGEHGWGQCRIECVDGMALLARQRVGVPHEDSKSVVDAITEVVESVYGPPDTAYDDNGDVLAHYGRSWQPEAMTVAGALLQICAAVYGRFYVDRAGTAVYRGRGRVQDGAVAAALVVGDDDVLDELVIEQDVKRVINRVQVAVYPVETVGQAQVIWTARTTLRIAPNSTRTIYTPFRDDNGERVGAVNVVPPVADTDYTVNEFKDGSGFDYTHGASFSINTTIEATRARIDLTSTATGPLYMTFLQVRGQPIRVYDPIVIEEQDTTSQAVYDVRAQVLDLAMQPDPMFAKSYAEYLIGRYSEPTPVVDRVTFRGQDQVNGVWLWSVGLSSKVAISDVQTGVSNLGHLVRGIDYDLRPQTYTVQLQLERADERQYWFLGKPGASELDHTTRLAF